MFSKILRSINRTKPQKRRDKPKPRDDIPRRKENRLSKQKTESKLREKSRRDCSYRDPGAWKVERSNLRNRSSGLNHINGERRSRERREMCRDKLVCVTRSRISRVSSKYKEALCQRVHHM